MKADLAARSSAGRARNCISKQSGKLNRVTICRELRHTDQLIKLDHGGTDRRQKTNGFVLFRVPHTLRRTNFATRFWQRKSGMRTRFGRNFTAFSRLDKTLHFILFFKRPPSQWKVTFSPPAAGFAPFRPFAPYSDRAFIVGFLTPLGGRRGLIGGRVAARLFCIFLFRLGRDLNLFHLAMNTRSI